MQDCGYIVGYFVGILGNTQFLTRRSRTHHPHVKSADFFDLALPPSMYPPNLKFWLEAGGGGQGQAGTLGISKYIYGI